MISFKPIPRETPARTPVRSTAKPKKQFKIHPVSSGKIGNDQMAWVARRIADMLSDKRKDLSKEEINQTIDYVRLLLHKMQVIKTKKLEQLASEFIEKTKKQKSNKKKKI